MASNREGRGRLSSIDLLPSEADPHIDWAVQQLLNRERSQADILFELNDRLEVIGCETVSRSAFNRFSTRKAALTRRIDEMRQVAEAVTTAIGPEKADDATIMLVQLIKQATMEILERGNVGSKELMELSRALSSAIAAQKSSAVDRRKIEQERLEKENREQMDKAAHAAADGISKAAPGLDPARVLDMIRGAYGIGEA